MAQAPSAPASRTGTWTALGNPAFRNFWIFSFLAFIGASMQSVGAGWLMTQLDPSPLLVSLVQGSFTLSQFLMALPAGVLADLIERRWVMLGALGSMMVAAALLGGISLAGVATPASLIALTFLFGLAAAGMTPAMQATMPDLVSRELLPSALTLNGMTVSVARAVGPGLAGLLLALWGAGGMFLLNVLAFVGLFVVIVRWRNRPPKIAADARFKAALIDGLRFAVNQPPVRRLLLKSACNFFAVSIVLALIPAVVEGLLDGRPQTLGLLLACFGIGSVLGSFTLGRLYASLSRSRVIDLANVSHGIAVLIIAVSDNVYIIAGAMLLAGLSWTSITTSVNIVAQMLLPAAYRARGLAANIMAMMGSLTLGAALWGKLAEQYGLQQAFLVAGVMGVLMPLLTARLRLVEQLGEGVPVAAGAVEQSR